jgi:AraC-like DNA-binding protein
MNYDALVHEVDRYCEMYYAQPIRLRDIADYFHVSPRTIMRQFQQRTGSTIMAYLHDVRLRKAAWLLQHSDLPISEVAHTCGLQANYFSRTFTMHYGVSPMRYREQKLEE